MRPEERLVRRPYRKGILLAIAIIIGATMGHAAPQDRPDENTQLRAAFLYWQKGYALHMLGQYEVAARLFRLSIEASPTAEGHTFLGWSLSHLDRPEEAIGECKKAIAIDPDYGNPYNDIGVYLIDLGRAEEAVPWFEKAMQAKRYCCYQFPHFNMGRILLIQGLIEKAERAFERALSYEPDYLPARKALEYVYSLQGEPL